MVSHVHGCFPTVQNCREVVGSTYEVSDDNHQQQSILRRSANYQPSLWNYNYIQSLTSDYLQESYAKQANKLKIQVSVIVENVNANTLEKLELIDTLQRLGLSYHFENEINKILEDIYKSNRKDKTWNKSNLHATSLEFRLLRQHGYNISQEVFSSFMNEQGSLKVCFSKDIKGILSLYEASYLLLEDEIILEDARTFTTKYLIDYHSMNHGKDETMVSILLIRHALEAPLHWRVQRLETIWFIDYYKEKQDMNPILLELAKLDFNMVQAIYQQDLKQESRWWKNIGFEEKLSFARSRLVENFLWSVGFTFEPELKGYRQMVTKIASLVTTIDDIYDVYGTQDELELFTDIVKRWDVNAIGQLPDYMKICFLGLYNTVNEMGFDVLKEHKIDVIPHLTNAWAELCESYLLEAKWYYSKYVPNLEEYMENAWISIGGAIVLKHIYIITNAIKKKPVLEGLDEYHNIMRLASTIGRLLDDLGTSSSELKRGDVLKSIQCHMQETGTSEEDARKHIQYLLDEMWKKINRERIIRSLVLNSKTIMFNEIATNMARMSLCLYQFGDSYGDGHSVKDYVLSILVHPIS